MLRRVSADRRETFGSWSVGGTPRHLPDGLAVELPAGCDLILASHFHPSGKAENEKTRVGLFFADKKPENTYTTFMIPPVYGAISGIDIPAGEANYHLRDSFTLPVETRVVNAWAHAHMVCKSAFAEATLPDGTKRVMLELPEWVFDWQERYDYAQAITLPAGKRIDVDIVYDNSTGNAANPFSPPRRVRWGPESTDEIGRSAVRCSRDQSRRTPGAEGSGAPTDGRGGPQAAFCERRRPKSPLGRTDATPRQEQ